MSRFGTCLKESRTCADVEWRLRRDRPLHSPRVWLKIEVVRFVVCRKGLPMTSYPVSEPNVNINAAIATPTDRVRWGPIIAGLFAALSTLAVLTVLGVAVAGSTYDPGDSARAFGIGAGIWSTISALIAFFIGGWLASRSAAVRSEGSGLLNGAMVWVVAIPLMLYMIMGGVGSLFHAAGSAAATGAQVASNTASVACGVPGTDARTLERGCSTEICLKSAGKDGVANVHGPSSVAALNQRPATRK